MQSRHGAHASLDLVKAKADLASQQTEITKLQSQLTSAQNVLQHMSADLNLYIQLGSIKYTFSDDGNLNIFNGSTGCWAANAGSTHKCGW